MSNENNVQTQEELMAEIARLKAENSKLQAKANSVVTGNSLSLRVSEKGAICVYGLGRFPLTLYRSQMERLLAIVPDIQEFIKNNQDKLTVKEKKEAA